MADYWLWPASGEDWEEGLGRGMEAGWVALVRWGREKGLVQQPLVVALPFESVVPLPLLQSPDCIVRRPSLH